MSVEDRVAVITGATGGLGRVVARRLGEAGAHLALVATNRERLEALAGELALPEERVLVHAADLGVPEGARSAAAAVMGRFGRAEVLVHAVGGWIGGKPVEEVAADEVAQMLRQHLWSTFHLAQAFIPHLAAAGWGRLVVVSSPQASDPGPRAVPYAVAKAAQEALVLGLAREVGKVGVTANVLRVHAIDAKHERDRSPGSKTASWTTPEEIAAAILHLCSDEGGATSGARIPLYRSA